VKTRLKLTFRLTLLFLLFVALSIELTGTLAYYSSRNALQNATIAGLVAASVEKEAALNNWIEEGKRHVTTLAVSPQLCAHVAILVATPPGSADFQAAHDSLLAELSLWAGPGYYFVSLFVIEPESGQIIASTEASDEGEYREDRPYFLQGRAGPYVQNPYYSTTTQGPIMTASAPMRAEDGRLLAVLAGNMSLDAVSAIITRHTDPYRTHDAYLVNTSHSFVTQPCLISDPAVLQSGIYTEAVNRALAGQNGSILANDYRGVPVISAYRWLPERQLGLIVSVDQAEAFAPVRRLGNNLLFMSGIFLLFALATSVILARTITGPIRALQEGAARLGRGELGYRVKAVTRDEIGRLAEAFNEMAANLQATLAENARLYQETRAWAAELEKRVEERTADLRESEERLAQEHYLVNTLMQHIPDHIYFKDAESRFIRINSALVKYFGLSDAAQAVGKTDFDFFGPEHARQAYADEQEVMRSGQPLTKEEKEIWPDGRETYVSTTKIPSYDQAGKIIGTCGISRDITARRRAETALRESEERYRLIADHVGDVVWQLDTGLRFVYLSPAVERVLGYTIEEALGVHVTSFLNEEGVAQMREVVQSRLKNPKASTEPRAYRMKHRDGHWMDVEVASSPIFGDDGHVIGFAGITRDITERKRAEEALRALSARQEALLSAVPDIIMEVDPNKVYTWANRAGLEFFGQDVIGKEAAYYFEGEQDTYGVVRPLFDGNEDVIYVESWQRRKDGQKRLLAWWCRVLKDEQGNVTGALSTARDITERKRAEEEKERLQAQLVQAQKMESVGRLAGGVAHDFNNLLTVINLYSSLALSSLNETDPLRQDLEEIRKAGERAAGLTRQLLAFSRRQVLEMRVLDLNEVLGGLSKMLPRLISEDIAVKMSLAPDLGRTRADPGQIEQVVINLAVNARDAMQEGGKLILETANVTLDERYTQEHTEVIPGDYVMLAISDTGIGMSAEVKAHLFEPFFTTKGVGKGTGLGLAMVYGIVKQHQGHISVYSELGQGTTIKIYLPRVKEEVGVFAPTGQAAAMLRGSETVLVAEDEPAVRGIAVRVLREQGYTVLEAANGTEALRVALAHGKRPDLLLTDVIMPEMKGKALAEQLCARWPGLKVLYISGYTDETIANQGVLDQDAAFLQKPFGPETLARKVREVLDEGKSLGAGLE